MTSKLIKFEFRSSFRLLLIVWAALLVMTVIMCLMAGSSVLSPLMAFSPYPSGAFFSIVQGILWVLYIGIFAALIVLTIAIVILRFYRGLLGEEGYLMHTLPVKEWQLITAKGVVAVCAVLGSIVVGTLSIFLITISESIASTDQILSDLGKTLANNPILILVGLEIMIIVILGLLKSIYQIYASISIGQLLNRHRLLTSLGAYIGIDLVLSAIVNLIMSLLAATGLTHCIETWLFRINVFIVDGDMSGFGSLQIILLAIFLAVAVQLIIFHVISERMLTRKLNLL